jgi:tripartite-type tricarboxylate transporter receptor subunit TctC
VFRTEQSVIGGNGKTNGIPGLKGPWRFSVEPWMARLLIPFAIVCVIATSSAAGADVCPARSVRVLVGFPPGRTIDFLARLIAPPLGEFFHHQFVIDNRPGASGNVATEIAAKARADGCTFLAVSPAFASNVYLNSKPHYDPLTTFTPVARIATVHNVLVVHPSVFVQRVADLVDYAKARPGQLVFGVVGSSSSSLLAIELMRTRVGGFNVLQVPYKSIGPLLVDLLAGEVDAAVLTTPTALPHIRNRTLKPLAVATLKRVAALPDVPTFEEAGFPGFEAAAWNGIVAPAGTPYDTVIRLNLAIASVVRMPDVKERLAALGAEPIGDTTEEFRSYIRNEMRKWDRVVRATGVRLD